MANLSNVYAFNLKVASASEDQVVIANEIGESEFRDALDKLAKIFIDTSLESSVKLNKMLDIGIQFLDMPNGVLGSVLGESLEVMGVAGDIASIVTINDKISIAGSLCSSVFESDEPIALHNIPESNYSDFPAASIASRKSYMGTQVLTANGPFGTVCFFSNDVRERPFNTHEIRILNTIANWAGSIIGNDEQLEFLSHQNDYYRSLFGTVPSMMMLCNQDGLILSTSDRLCEVIGIDALKLPGQNCQNYFNNSEHEALTAALTIGDFEQLPLTLNRSSGEKLEVELSSSIKSLGSMQGVRMIVLSDVSDRNKAMKAVEEQNKKLALVNKSLNQFAVIASHDLQEPLRKIQQFSNFLEEDLGKTITEDGQYHLKVIVNSAQRMSTLIQDLLEFSSATKDELVVTDVDLSALLEDVCSDLELRIDESNAQVIIADLPTVQGDRSLIRQLFTNLVSNSLKYRDATRDPIIKIDVKPVDGNTAIVIADNGIGFDQKHASKAFEPFNRLHTSKEYKGNGIGLSICATVCEKHNWELSAASEPGIGSTFTILMAS